MGSGGFSGNQSVHWHIAHDDGADAQPTVTGIDVLQKKGFKALGSGSHGRKTHKGSFALTLRFSNMAEGRAALQGAIDSIESHGRYVTATLYVPAINRKKAQQNPPPEVKVDW
jgi:hypothetical protein